VRYHRPDVDEPRGWEFLAEPPKTMSVGEGRTNLLAVFDLPFGRRKRQSLAGRAHTLRFLGGLTYSFADGHSIVNSERTLE